MQKNPLSGSWHTNGLGLIQIPAIRRLECRIAHVARTMEARLGVRAVALIVGIVCLLLAMIYVQPATHPSKLGWEFAKLATDPFPTGEQNLVAFRILAPLISHLLGLRGNGILITNLLFALLLISLIYYHLRRSRLSPYFAGICAFAFSLSSPTIVTVAHGGYTDSLTYLLLAIGYICRRSPCVFWMTFGLGLFNREAILFLLPWLIYLRWNEIRNTRRFLWEVLPWTIISIGLYCLFRLWMASRLDVVFNVHYYLDPLLKDPLKWWKGSFGFQLLGLFTVFKLLWLVPVVAAYHFWRMHDRRIFASMCLLLGCTGAQFLVAIDSTRLFCMAFPLIIVAWEGLIPSNRYQIKRWIFLLILGNVLVPNIYTAATVIMVQHGLLYKFLRHLM